MGTRSSRELSPAPKFHGAIWARCGDTITFFFFDHVLGVHFLGAGSSAWRSGFSRLIGAVRRFEGTFYVWPKSWRPNPHGPNAAQRAWQRDRQDTGRRRSDPLAPKPTFHPLVDTVLPCPRRARRLIHETAIVPARQRCAKNAPNEGSGAIGRFTVSSFSLWIEADGTTF